MSGASSSSAARPASASEQTQLVQTVLAASDHYAVLQVERHATTQEIKKAYKRLALKIHPDKNRAPHAVEAFKRALEALESLTGGVRIRPYESAPEQTAPTSRVSSSSTESESESYSTAEESEEEEAEVDGARSSRSCSAAQPATRAKQSAPESENNQAASSRTEAMSAEELRAYI